MAQRRNGSPPTLEEIRAYADYLEQQLFRMNKEMVDSTKDGHNGDIKLLNLQQERIMDDIRSINSTLKDLSIQLTQIPVLASKQEENYQAMTRAHKRLDKLAEEFNSYKDKFDDKLQKLEVHQAKGAWLERLGMAVVFGIVTLWSKGAL